MKSARMLLPLFGLAIASPVAWSQQAAHVHGIASLDLVYDQGELQMEFRSPSDSLVGFEYAPSTDAEHKAVDEALALLQKPDALFVLPASAGCKIEEVEAERHGEDDDHGHGDHAKHDDDHDDDHGHDDHAKHDDDHGHDDHAKHDDDHDDHGHDDKEAAVHSEFHAHYHFDCNGSAIGSIELKMFDVWPRLERITLQAITAGGQTGGNIDASDPVIRLQ